MACYNDSSAIVGIQTVYFIESSQCQKLEAAIEISSSLKHFYYNH